MKARDVGGSRRGGHEIATRYHLRAVAAGTMICLLAACATTAPIPISDYARVEPGERVHLDVVTAHARYRATQFSATDSTLVIEAVWVGGDTYPSSVSRWKAPPALPYTIPFSAVVSMHRVQEPHPMMSVLGGVTLVVAIMSVVMMAAFAHVGVGAD
jgi:hypothetical protein